MATQYQILMRQKRAAGRLGREEQRALAEERHVEFVRRYNALYGTGSFNRRLAQLGCAIAEVFKPLLDTISKALSHISSPWRFL